MDWQRIRLGIRTLGWPQLWRSVRYSLQRGWLEWRTRPHRQAGAPEAPGKLLGADPLPGGGSFRFAALSLELRFLTPDMVRVSWKPARPPLPYALSQVEWPTPRVGLSKTTDYWSLTSDAMEVLVQDDGSLRFRTREGHTLRQEFPPLRHGESWVQRARLRPEEQIHGLGERAAPLNLRRGSYRLWNQDPQIHYGPGVDPLYMGIPVVLGLHREGSYLAFYENSYPASFTFDQVAEARFEGGMLRYYLTLGPPARALQRYAELTGRPPLPPRWALGYHQSRWGYCSEGEVREVVAGFREHDLPLSVLHLDIDYMEGYRVFTVDQQRFPDLAGLASELAGQGVRLVAIVDPGVKRDPTYSLYREGLEQGHFCRLPSGRPAEAVVWPGWCAFPDFSDPQARSWWGQQYRGLLNEGIAGFWHDMNEPAAFAAWGLPTLPRSVQHALEGRRGDHAEAHNLYGLLMNRAGYEALRQLRPDRRPFLLSRSGWAGLQRYAWNWTGDVESSWPALRQTVPTVLGLGLSGIPYSGPDIGGFSGSPDAELYLRWFQLAAFLPFFRTHSAWDTDRREPWVYGEPSLSIVRHFLQLRGRLMPYLYTLAWEASQSGHPLVRPLFWPDADDPTLWDVQDAFFLGPALLVAPVLEEGIRSREVPLPEGLWFDFWDDGLLQGPGQVSRDAPLETIPLLVRAGSILPLQEGDSLALHLYPTPSGTAKGTLYSDAGDGFGTSRLDSFQMLPSREGIELTWDQEGDLGFPYRGAVIHIHGRDVQRIWVDGVETPVAQNRLATDMFQRVWWEETPPRLTH